MAAGMLAAAKGWRLMAGMAAGMLTAAEGRKEYEFSRLLRSLQQLREIDFAQQMTPTLERVRVFLYFQ
ncbi:hypothetical protein Pyn_19428 [Prunus yedoensis var. nudiflora]|uniref:Uncharacterized protein n=1 Tax=Prunus yedoensis var. nudiflora TaxID=2094558 RepID=A0A314Y738_PRUYE|nr:hypothetical protein Pyn_19428 [Prunus yedoensis var. nudiflora]